MEEQNKPLIVLKDVTVGTSDKSRNPLIESVNWEVYPGEFWVIGGLGESGKTALLLTIVGVFKPLKGDVILFSKNLFEVNESELAKLRLKTGFVFEGSGNLFQHLTVEENVVLPLLYHLECDRRWAEEKAAEVLEFVEMKNYARKLPHQVPRQLLKRVALARALIMSPEVLIIDDPLKNLDVTQEQWWVQKIEALAKNKNLRVKNPSAIIVASSDLRPWMSINHKVAIIHENEYKYLGETEIVYKKPDPCLSRLLTGEERNG